MTPAYWVGCQYFTPPDDTGTGGREGEIKLISVMTSEALARGESQTPTAGQGWRIHGLSKIWAEGTGTLGEEATQHNGNPTPAGGEFVLVGTTTWCSDQ